MSRLARPSRRRLLLGGLATLLLVATGWLRALRPRATRIDLGSGWASLLPDRARIRGLAEAYLRAHPHERDPRELERLLCRDIGRPESGRSARSRMRKALVRRIERDFEQGELVSIDGWLLSRSEARVCAIALLEGPTRSADTTPTTQAPLLRRERDAYAGRS